MWCVTLKFLFCRRHSTCYYTLPAAARGKVAEHDNIPQHSTQRWPLAASFSTPSKHATFPGKHYGRSSPSYATPGMPKSSTSSESWRSGPRITAFPSRDHATWLMIRTLRHVVSSHTCLLLGNKAIIVFIYSIKHAPNSDKRKTFDAFSELCWSSCTLIIAWMTVLVLENRFM